MAVVGGAAAADRRDLYRLAGDSWPGTQSLGGDPQHLAHGGVSALPDRRPGLAGGGLTPAQPPAAPATRQHRGGLCRGTAQQPGLAVAQPCATEPRPAGRRQYPDQHRRARTRPDGAAPALARPPGQPCRRADDRRQYPGRRHHLLSARRTEPGEPGAVSRRPAAMAALTACSGQRLPLERGTAQAGPRRTTARVARQPAGDVGTHGQGPGR